MSVVEVGRRYRVTLTRDVRERVPVKEGQKVYLLPYTGNTILIIPIPKGEELYKALARLTEGVTYNREARRKAEEYLLKEVSAK